MRLWTLLACVLFLAVPAVATQVTSFDDPAGDPDTSGGPAVGNDAVDILGASLAISGSDIVSTVTVADLDAVTETSTGVNADTMFIVRWNVDEGPEAGEWTLRADYQPMATTPWSYWAEGPCRDGNDDDGCAGEDRDIIDGLEGAHDMENDTVQVRLPVERLGPMTGQVWGDFHATAQQVWPTYPVYTSDWAYAPDGEQYTFDDPPANAATGTSTSTSSASSTSASSSSTSSAPSSTSSTSAAPTTPGDQDSGTSAPPTRGSADSPMPAWPVLGILGLLLARRR